jgi:hypothetical protein
MEHSPWEAKNHLGSQEIPRLLWTAKVQYRVHEPTTGPYPKPDENSPQYAIIFPEDPF